MSPKIGNHKYINIGSGIGNSNQNVPGTMHQNSWGCKQAAMKKEPDKEIKKIADGDPIPSSPN